MTAARGTELGSVRDPLWVVGLPLTGVPRLEGFALVVFLPLRDRQVLSDAGNTADSGDRPHVRERAVLATGITFSIADAQADDCPLVWVNPAFTFTTGYTEADALGHNCRFLQGLGTHPAHVAALRDGLDSGRDVTVTLLNYRKDGSGFWNECTLSPIYDAAGVITHYVGIQSDVTARVAANDERDRALAAQQASERALRAERDLSDHMLATMGSLVLVTDPDGTIRRFNQACQRLTGFTEGDVVGRRLEEVLVPAGERQSVHDGFGDLRTGRFRKDAMGRPSEREDLWIDRDGQAHTVLLTHTVLLNPDDTVRGLLSAGVDVTDRNLAQEQLTRQALYDPLTGLANRLLLHEHLDTALARATRNRTRVAVLFLDLDNFKTVNDRLGHAAGDQLLIDIADRLRDCLRDTDTAARLGGDEFVVLAEALTDAQQAQVLLRRIQQALHMSVPNSDGSMTVTVSVGLALSDETSTTEQLLQKADLDMYQAKCGGRDRHHLARPRVRGEGFARSAE